MIIWIFNDWFPEFLNIKFHKNTLSESVTLSYKQMSWTVSRTCHLHRQSTVCSHYMQRMTKCVQGSGSIYKLYLFASNFWSQVKLDLGDRVQNLFPSWHQVVWKLSPRCDTDQPASLHLAHVPQLCLKLNRKWDNQMTHAFVVRLTNMMIINGNHEVCGRSAYSVI